MGAFVRPARSDADCGVARGGALAQHRKTQRKPLELLKALIAFGGRAVLEEQLTEALWPEAKGHAAHQAFTLPHPRYPPSVDRCLGL
jgi:hypothetical protein